MGGPLSDRASIRPGLLLVLGAAAALYFVALDPLKFGFLHDDGIYAVTAKSIACGSGCRISSLPGAPHQTKYPPLYPVVLSAIWRVFPNFPSNVVALLLPSTIFTLAGLFCAERYLAYRAPRDRALALVAIGLAAFNPRTVILATSALSEPLYAFLSIAVLGAAESHTRKASLRTSAVLSAALALAVLTRISALSVLPAVAAFALIRRNSRCALVPVSVALLVFAGWTAWAHAHASQPTGSAMTYYTSYLGDWKQILSSGGPVNYLQVVAQNLFMLVPISVPLVCLGFGYSSIAGLQGPWFVAGLLALMVTFGLVCAGFLAHARAGLRIVHLYILFYILQHAVWPYSSYDRFLVPLLPFICFFLVLGIARTVELLKQGYFQLRVSRLILFATLSAVPVLVAWGNVEGVWKETVLSRGVFADRARDDESVCQWIRDRARRDDILVCYPDPKYYLWTGNPAIAPFVAAKPGCSDSGTIASLMPEAQVRYLIDAKTSFAAFRPDIAGEGFQLLMQACPHLLAPVFQTGSSTIYAVAQPERNTDSQVRSDDRRAN